MFHLLVASLSVCKGEKMKKPCSDHGECINDVCVCYASFVLTEAAPFCTVCAPGFDPSGDSTNRCVSRKYCKTHLQEGDMSECYGHGFCTAEDNKNLETAWYCRCVSHFVNETRDGRHKVVTNCSTCDKKYTLTKDDVCITGVCQSRVYEENGTPMADECSNYGTCIDPVSQSGKINILISIIESLLKELFDINVPGCFCRGRNMDAICDKCKPMFEKHEHDNKTDCYPDRCRLFDENKTALTTNCNSQGNCSFDSYREEFTCKCNQGYDASKSCSQCLNKLTLASGCTQCEPGWDLNTSCFQCEFGKDEATSCQTCLEGYDIAQNCRACIGGYDVYSRCEKCPHGMADVGDKCVKSNEAGSNTALIVVGVIVGVAALLAAVFVTLHFMRKKRTAQYQVVDLDAEPMQE